MHNMIQEPNLTLTLSTLISNTVDCMAYVAQVVTKYYLTNVFIVFNAHSLFNLIIYILILRNYMNSM